MTRSRQIWGVAILLVAGAVGGVAWWMFGGADDELASVELEPLAAVDPVDEEEIDQLCSHCHQRPTPEALPKTRWSKTIWTMSTFGGFGSNVRGKVDPEAVVAWFSERAPEKLHLPEVTTSQGPGNLKMVKREISWHGATAAPFVSHIRVVDVVGSSRPELLMCDMRNGTLLLAQTDQPGWTLEPIGRVPYPAHVEAADLDADGHTDLVVANLGSFLALDHKVGSVDWLRQQPDGRFEHGVLAADLGRVADVEPVDLDADGDLDLVVAEFGWRWTGRFLVLENHAEPGEPPRFVVRQLDGLHGGSHVATPDLDGDGLFDLVTLYSQEHELVRCYLNRENRWTEFEDLYRAPHPAWGHSGFEPADLDHDGDIDLLLTNGDTYDDGLLKPYHGVRWLENRGNLRFEPHDLVQMYGAYRAEAADLDGDGDLDIVACALAEVQHLDDTRQATDHFESILWMEQVEPGKYVHRTFESDKCSHPTLTLADYDQDGDIDLLVGNGRFDDVLISPQSSCIDLWENQRKQ